MLSVPYKRRLLLDQPAFLPSDESGLVFWPRYNQGITEEGAGASVWADASGNGNDVLQGTDANRPLIEPDGTILFDGVDQFMQATFTLNQPFTFYALLRQISWTTNDQLWSGIDATVSLFQISVSPTVALFAGSAAAANNQLILNTYFPVAAVFNGNNSSLKVGSGGKTTGAIGGSNPGGVTLGSSNVPSVYSNVQYKEIAVFLGVHSDSQQGKMITYLSSIP